MDNLTDFSQCHDKNEMDAIQYISNFVFNDTLDSVSNNKFPGSLVVSVSRKDLPLIHGIPSDYRKYKDAEILSWIHPTKRFIPPVTINRKQQLQAKQTRYHNKKHDIDINTLDFGDESGLFYYLNKTFQKINEIDFGNENGQFFIVSF